MHNILSLLEFENCLFIVTLICALGSHLFHLRRRSIQTQESIRPEICYRLRLDRPTGLVADEPALIIEITNEVPPSYKLTVCLTSRYVDDDRIVPASDVFSHAFDFIDPVYLVQRLFSL